MRRLLALALLLVILPAASALADAPDVEFPSVARHGTETLTGGADLELGLRAQRDSDLAPETSDDALLTRYEISPVWVTGDQRHWLVFNEWRLSSNNALSRQDEYDDSLRARLQLRELYLRVTDARQRRAVTLGRQAIEDTRGWWWDEQVDGLSVGFYSQDRSFTLIAAQDEAFDGDLFNTAEPDRRNLLALRYQTLTRQSEMEWLAVALHDDDRQQLHAGWQWHFTPHADLQSHVVVASLTGSDDGQSLLAFAAEAGLIRRWPGNPSPFLGVNLAIGSGDDDSRDKRDTRFRQTGLQDNEYRSFGLSKMTSYGRLSDASPENLAIVSLLGGWRIGADASFELRLHHYQQVVADADLSGTDIGADADGRQRAVGSELNLAWQWRLSRDWGVELKFGQFFPGAALPDSEDASVFDVTLKWRM